MVLGYGHTQAEHYTLGRLFDEAALIQERENNRIVTEATLLQLAIQSVLSKKAGREFAKTVKQLNVTTKPQDGRFE